jgi:hypothetical protein
MLVHVRCVLICSIAEESNRALLSSGCGSCLTYGTEHARGTRQTVSLIIGRNRCRVRIVAIWALYLGVHGMG